MPSLSGKNGSIFSILFPSIPSSRAELLYVRPELAAETSTEGREAGYSGRKLDGERSQAQIEGSPRFYSRVARVAVQTRPMRPQISRQRRESSPCWPQILPRALLLLRRLRVSCSSPIAALHPCRTLTSSFSLQVRASRKSTTTLQSRGANP